MASRSPYPPKHPSRLASGSSALSNWEIQLFDCPSLQQRFRRFWSLGLMGCLVGTLVFSAIGLQLWSAAPAQAAPVSSGASAPAVTSVDRVSGAQLFDTHCIGCHVKGSNIIRRGKNLKLRTLRRDGLDSLEAIAQLVANGKNAMSAYADRLTEAEIIEVSAYVLDQAAQDWATASSL